MAHMYFSVPILILEPVKFWPLPEKKKKKKKTIF